MALTVTAIVWHKVPGHVHPTFEPVAVDRADVATDGAGASTGTTGAPVVAQAAVGVSTEVQ